MRIKSIRKTEIALHAALDRAVENRSPYVVEYRVLDDHKVRWIASQGTVFVDRSGNPVSIIGTSADITERKTAEENRVRGDVLLNSIVEGVIYLNAQGKLIYLNAAAERLLGFRSTEVCGKSMHELIHGKHPYPREGANDSCPIIDVVNTGEPYRNNDDYFRRRDGTFLNVEYTSAPLLLDGSKAYIANPHPLLARLEKDLQARGPRNRDGYGGGHRPGNQTTTLSAFLHHQREQKGPESDCGPAMKL